VRVLADTTIWSLALRRKPGSLNPTEASLVSAWADLVRDGRVVLLGIIRQEVLSGIADSRQFKQLRDALAAFRDEPVVTADHVRAAEGFNRCRVKGVQGSPVDFLIFAVAERLSAPIFTTDSDFEHFAPHLPIRFYKAAARG